MNARVDAANDLGALMTEDQARTDFTAAPTIMGLPVSLKDRFLLDESESELERQALALAIQATAKGMPPDNL